MLEVAYIALCLVIAVAALNGTVFLLRLTRLFDTPVGEDSLQGPIFAKRWFWAFLLGSVGTFGLTIAVMETPPLRYLSAYVAEQRFKGNLEWCRVHREVSETIENCIDRITSSDR
jgi:hypothetical protein